MSHSQEAYLEREELDQTAGAAGYGSTNSVKHGKMEDALLNFASATSARDENFTNITASNDNLYTHLRQQE